MSSSPTTEQLVEAVERVDMLALRVDEIEETLEKYDELLTLMARHLKRLLLAHPEVINRVQP